MIVGRGVWRFARLVAVGLAWGGPLLPLVAVDSAPGVAVHPNLARPLDQHHWQFFLAMIVLCCVGVAVVALLTRSPSRVKIAWVFVPVALSLAVVGVLTGPPGSYTAFLIYTVTLMALPIALVSLGAAVTVATLWRRSRWLAGMWLALWLGGVVFVQIATQQTPDSGTPGDGLLLMGLIAALLFVAVFAAALGSVVGSVSDWMAWARHVEHEETP